MAAIETLIFIYLSGVSGFLLGTAICKFPRNLDDLETVLNCSLLWPLSAFHSYNREVQKQALNLHRENVRALFAELHHRERLLQIMSAEAMKQNKEYQELLEKYNELENLSHSPTHKKESAKGKRENEPL